MRSNCAGSLAGQHRRDRVAGTRDRARGSETDGARAMDGD
jgi:hypothetical protein